MRKALFLFFCLCISYITTAQTSKLGEFDIIFWDKNYNLKWSDFKFKTGKKSECSNNAESCILIIGYPQIIDDKISMNIVNVFVKNKSWKTGEVKFQLLEHEQIHFDISEYYTRLIRYYLSNIEFNTRTEAQAFVDICADMYNNDQRLFDLETKHGLNLKEQSLWREKINANIISLDKYYKSSFTPDELSRFEKLIKTKYKN